MAAFRNHTPATVDPLPMPEPMPVPAPFDQPSLSLAERLTQARRLADEAKAAEDAVIAAEDAERRRIAEVEAKAAAEAAAKWDRLREDRESSAAAVAALEAEIERQRLEAVRDAVEGCEAARTLFSRAVESHASLVGATHDGLLSAAQLGEVYVSMVTGGLVVPAELWHSSDILTAEVEAAGLSWFVVKDGGPVEPYSARLLVRDPSGALTEVWALADLARVWPGRAA